MSIPYITPVEPEVSNPNRSYLGASIPVGNPSIIATPQISYIPVVSFVPPAHSTLSIPQKSNVTGIKVVPIYDDF